MVKGKYINSNVNYYYDINNNLRQCYFYKDSRD